MEKHIFAIHFQNISDLICNLKSGQNIEIKDKDLLKRLTKVLRLHANEAFILFDKSTNVEFKLLEKSFESKNTIYASIIKISDIIVLVR